jgi:hypothetical protein
MQSIAMLLRDIAMRDDANVSVYNQTYHHYLEQLKAMRFAGKENLLGISVADDAVAVPYFGQSIYLTADGLIDASGKRPDFADCVVVCRYLIMCPSVEPTLNDWVAYRDFPDAGPLTVFWSDTVEGAITKTFSGHVDRLRRASDRLGGMPAKMDIACDHCCRFAPLPKVPLLLVFNDADDDFPAAASLLFERRASTYLDAESQAILGHALVNRLMDAVSG